MHSSIKLVENNRGGKELKIQHNIIVGADELEPLNIASSFAQALLLSLYRERNNLNTSVTELAKKLDELQNDFGPVKNIIDILFFSSKRRQGINSLQVEIEKNRSEIRNLFSHEERLLSIANSSQ